MSGCEITNLEAGGGLYPRGVALDEGFSDEEPGWTVVKETARVPDTPGGGFT